MLETCTSYRGKDGASLRSRCNAPALVRRFLGKTEAGIPIIWVQVAKWNPHEYKIEEYEKVREGEEDAANVPPH